VCKVSYAEISNTHTFLPVAVETLGPSVLNLGHAVSLNLNIAKCDGIVTDPTLLSFVHIQSTDAELLGSHFFPDLQLGQGDEDLAIAVDRLAAIRSQDVLVLLRVSFSAPRVQSLLRCSPSVHISAPQTLDDHSVQYYQLRFV